jgi:hypothetical protein
MTSLTSTLTAPVESRIYSKSFNDFVAANDVRINDVAEKFSEYVINAQTIEFDGAKDRIVHWLGNFDIIGFNNYSILLVLLEQFEFVSYREISKKLVFKARESKMWGEKLGATYVTHLGEHIESSYRLTSHFNQHQNFRKDLAELLDSIEEGTDFNILFFDDFLNSGGQFVSIFYALLNQELPDGAINDEWESRTKLNAGQIRKLRTASIHVYFYTAFDEGLESVEHRIKSELGLNVRVYRHLATNVNQGAFGDKIDQRNIVNGVSGRMTTPCSFSGKKYSELTDLYQTLLTVGEELSRQSEPNWSAEKCSSRALGYGNKCRLISTDYNVPTVTITALWRSGKITINGIDVTWRELIPRTKKVIPKKHQPLEELEDNLIQSVILSAEKMRAKMIPSVQTVVRAYLTLNDVEKNQLYLDLELEIDHSKSLAPTERDKLFFKLINEKNLLPDLWTRLTQVKRIKSKTNPF